MPSPKSRGPRVSMHHTQENTRQLPDSPGPSSPPLNPSLLAVYKQHIASLEPLSKSFRSYCEAPPFPPLPLEGNVSVQEWKRCRLVWESERREKAMLSR